MKLTFKNKIVSIIVSFSLLLIGFIGWGFSSKSFEKLYKKEVISRVYIDINDFTFSEYCEEGFIQDYTITNIAYLDINVFINLDKMKDYIDYNNFGFSTNLKYDNFEYNYFKIIETSFIDVSIIENFKYENDISMNDDEIYALFSLNDDLSSFNNISLTFRYTFDVSNYIKDSTFKDKVYSLLNNKGIPFNFRITIE